MEASAKYAMPPYYTLILISLFWKLIINCCHSLTDILFRSQRLLLWCLSLFYSLLSVRFAPVEYFVHFPCVRFTPMELFALCLEYILRLFSMVGMRDLLGCYLYNDYNCILSQFISNF